MTDPTRWDKTYELAKRVYTIDTWDFTNEIASQSGVGIELEEEAIPVSEPVRSACEFLGLDPLYIANEGKLIVIVPQEDAEKALEILHGFEACREATVVGKVTAENQGVVQMHTEIGGTRLVDWLNSDPLPRIC